MKTTTVKIRKLLCNGHLNQSVATIEIKIGTTERALSFSYKELDNFFLNYSTRITENKAQDNWAIL